MFIHLRAHTEYSIVDGSVRIAELLDTAQNDTQPALAITDLNNLFGAVKFYKAARSKGIQPILGAEVFLAEYGRALLLVQNHSGYLNLCELLARAWRQPDVRKNTDATIVLDWLAELNQGLLLLSGTSENRLSQAFLEQDWNKVEHWVTQFQSYFPERFYLEIQRAQRPDDEPHIQASLTFCAKQSNPPPLVATHPVQFLSADHFNAHEARVCIATGETLSNPRRPRVFTSDQYFKTQAEMEVLFADIPQAVQNTVEIAKRCNLMLTLDKAQLPHYPTPLGSDGQPLSIDAYFNATTYAGLENRLSARFPDPKIREEHRKQYEDRLLFEINTIINMGFPGYFLIVADFIGWAKHNGCPVGPGRGSGAGSLVAYSLGITELDPLQYNLLFERFLNPERVSMPDFDIDFCQSNRDRVIDYVKLKYGDKAVSQIATFGTLSARAVVRDVGRVMEYSYPFCDGISKLIPNKPGKSITIAQAIEEEPELKARFEEEEDVRLLLNMAQQLEGLPRNVGTHAGGVLIAPSKLTDYCPLYQQPGSDTAISQFDKDDVEAMGLVKFDFLGLATLTVIEDAKRLIRKHYPKHADFTIESIPLDDANVYQLFAQGKTEAVFQFESPGMRSLLRDVQPTCLEDLIAMNALYRPGPMEVIPSYTARKRGRESAQYPHPLVESILEETYGIMVYQEQVMQTAQILGGYSLGQADILRRAMGKKKAEEMAQQRETFRAGAAKKHIEKEQADGIFDLMEKFAGYGFNKSHAAAYSLLAYQTAWIKLHFKAVFFAANMTVEMGNTDKLRVLVNDAKQFDLTMEAPDINLSNYPFEPVSKSTVRYGLGALKGAGERAIEVILEVRTKDGPFTSFFDLVARVDKAHVNKRTLETLIRAGAFDKLHSNRAALLASLNLAMDFAELQVANANQTGLFDEDDSHAANTTEPELVSTPPWDIRSQLAEEKRALGFYLSGHLFDECENEIRKFIANDIAELQESQELQWLAGVLSKIRIITGKRGKMIMLELDDKSRTIEINCTEALLLQSIPNLTADKANATYGLREDSLLVVQGLVHFDRFSNELCMKARKILDLSSSRCFFGRFFQVTLTLRNKADTKTLDKMRTLLHEFPVKTLNTDQLKPQTLGLGLRVQVQTKDGVTGLYDLDSKHGFYPSNEALACWRQLDRNAHIVYA